MQHARPRRSLDERLLTGRHARHTGVALSLLLAVVGLTCAVAALALAAPAPLRAGLAAAGAWGVAVGLLAARDHVGRRTAT